MRNLVQRLGEPLARSAVGEALKILARQFVLGRNMAEAMQHASQDAAGTLYSYDMLGEAARTDADARRYFLAYAQAIAAIVGDATAADLHANARQGRLTCLLSSYHEPLVARRERTFVAYDPPSIRFVRWNDKRRPCPLSWEEQDLLF